jgi:hypothetical protein
VSAQIVETAYGAVFFSTITYSTMLNKHLLTLLQIMGILQLHLTRTDPVLTAAPPYITIATLLKR